MVTDHDMRDQVTQALGFEADEFDIDAIVEHVQRDHGTVNVDTVEHDTFWAIVAQHPLYAPKAKHPEDY